jgi:bifunctional non-homologous end joining protein LigD
VGRAPDLATTEFRIADRGGRVLVDIWRNAPSQTAVAPYSPRALPEATVSFPLTWRELPSARISDFRIRNVPELLDLPGPRAWDLLLTRRARLPSSLTEG